MPGVGSSPRPSFAFARFSNERISSINIGQATSGEIQRTEKVDAEAKPIDTEVPETSAAGFGFSNVTYDIIGVGQGATSTGTESVSLTPIQGINRASGSGSKPDAAEEHIYDVVEVGGFGRWQ
jgi:hypothetical protein